MICKLPGAWYHSVTPISPSLYKLNVIIAGPAADKACVCSASRSMCTDNVLSPSYLKASTKMLRLQNRHNVSLLRFHVAFQLAAGRVASQNIAYGAVKNSRPPSPAIAHCGLLQESIHLFLCSPCLCVSSIPAIYICASGLGFSSHRICHNKTWHSLAHPNQKRRP